MLENLQVLDTDDLAFFVDLFGRLNNGEPAGSEELWAGLDLELKRRGADNLTDYQITRIFSAFATAGKLDKTVQGVKSLKKVQNFQFSPKKNFSNF